MCLFVHTERLHPSLCAACQNATLCSSSDEYAGDEGALRCLLAGDGQVAFTTARAIERFLSRDRIEQRLVNNFAYLCLNGSKLSLESRPCEWAHKPTNVFVTGPNRQREKDWYLKHLQELFFKYVPFKPSWWRMRSLFSDHAHVTQILPVPTHLQQWDKYLGNFISSIEKPLPGCEPNSVSFCASNVAEELKCLDLQKAAFSQRIRPEIDCKLKQTKQECIEMVAKRQADLVVADISQLHEAPANVVAQLEPVAVAQGLEDYAVAVVRADSGVKFLYQLAGRRSCHASFGDTSSWLAPISVLAEQSLLDSQHCNKADQMAEYFGGSCVPGAADLRVNHYRSGSERLCALCRGNELAQHQCERSSSELYFGQAGALRCLVEGVGEVAFMSMTALALNVDGRSQEKWARNVPLAMDSRNFRLVCRTGPNVMLNEFKQCHLARLPGKVIVSTKFASEEERLTTRRLLAWLVDKFNVEHRAMFDLFGPYQNRSNLLFDDTTQRITPLQLDRSSFDAMTRMHMDPSFKQLPITHKGQACKVVLTTSGASSHSSARISLLTLLGAIIIGSAGSISIALLMLTSDPQIAPRTRI